jgi:hypothetical protein
MRNLDEMQRQFELHELRAQYWIAQAISGAAKDRKLYHGTITESGDSKPFTDAEKIADALSIANQHIQNASECAAAMEVARGAGVK